MQRDRSWAPSKAGPGEVVQVWAGSEQAGREKQTGVSHRVLSQVSTQIREAGSLALRTQQSVSWLCHLLAGTHPSESLSSHLKSEVHHHVYVKELF